MEDKNKSIFGNFKWIIYLMAFFIGIASGILTPLASTHLTQNNVGSVGIGFVSSAYFMFIALGSLLVNKMMLNKDIKKFVVFGLMLTAVSAIAFPYVTGVALWFILMSLMGVGISFYMVGSQTILHSLSDEESRGAVSGVFSTFFALGCIGSSTGGPMLYGLSKYIPFIAAGGALIFASAVMMAMIKGNIIIPSYPNKKVFKKISFALNGIFTYAFIETTLVALYPVFLLNHKYTFNQLGVALGIFGIGSVIGTIPFTTFADKIGREKTLVIGAIISLVGLVGIIGVDNYTVRIIFSLIAGIGIGPMYPVSMAVNAQNLKSDELQAGTAMFTSVYGCGSTLGPILSALVVNALGFWNMFNLSFIFFIVLVIHGGFILSNKAQIKGLTKEE